MAVFRNGALVGAISGTVGGLTFVAGRGSPVVRPSGTYLNRSQPITAHRRSQMSQLRQEWGDLTDAQRAGWRTAAAQVASTNALGVRTIKSGFNYFIGTNLQQMRSPLFFQLDPWPEPLTPPLPGFTAVFSVSGTYQVTTTGAASPADTIFYVFGYPYFRTTPTRAPSRPRQIDSGVGTSFSKDIKTAWTGDFGPLRVGQYFAVRMTRQFVDAPRSSQLEIRGFAVA